MGYAQSRRLMHTCADHCAKEADICCTGDLVTLEERKVVSFGEAGFVDDGAADEVGKAQSLDQHSNRHHAEGAVTYTGAVRAGDIGPARRQEGESRRGPIHGDHYPETKSSVPLLSAAGFSLGPFFAPVSSYTGSTRVT